MEKKHNQQVKWDVHYSTYYWKIHLDKLNPLNSPNVQMLQGYSKQERQSEAQDVQHLLKAKIMNLNKNGYLDRCQRIVIYQRSLEVINNRFDPDILILYPTHYDIPTHAHEYMHKRFGLFLDEFYKRKRDHLSMVGLLPNFKAKYSKDDYTNVLKMTGKIQTPSQLYSHAASLLINGQPQGVVDHFIYEFKNLKGWK